jgi:hypothetical protein
MTSSKTQRRNLLELNKIMIQIPQTSGTPGVRAMGEALAKLARRVA